MANMFGDEGPHLHLIFFCRLLSHYPPPMPPQDQVFVMTPLHALISPCISPKGTEYTLLYLPSTKIPQTRIPLVRGIPLRLGEFSILSTELSLLTTVWQTSRKSMIKVGAVHNLPPVVSLHLFRALLPVSTRHLMSTRPCNSMFPSNNFSSELMTPKSTH